MKNDQETRVAITKDLKHNFFVEAGAGSGKTSSLTDRYVGLILSGEAKIWQIAAVTFTKKAAAELRERSQIKLEAAASGLKISEYKEARQNAIEALMNFERASISTIHSFCARLLRERPVEARIDPGFEELEEEQNSLHAEECWSAFLKKKELSRDPKYLELMGDCVNPAELKATYLFLIGYPDVSKHTEKLPQPDLKAYASRLKTGLAALGSLLPAVEHDSGWDELQAKIIGALKMIDVGYLENNRKIAELLNFLEGEPGKTNYKWEESPRAIALYPEKLEERMAKTRKNPDLEDEKRKAKRAAGKSAAEEALAAYVAFSSGVVAEAITAWREYLHFPVMEFVQEAEAYYRTWREGRSLLNFQDLLMKAAALLRKSPEIRDYFKEKLKFIFVDEFQDTDPIQAELVMLLCGEDSKEDNWHKIKPKEGSLFVVGDPKQSIYRFRRADISIYKTVKAMFPDEQIGRLTKNYRSFNEIGKFVDGVFESQLTGGDFQAEFASLNTVNSTGEGYANGVFTFEIPPTSKGGSKRVKITQWEADKIASFIRNAVDSGYKLQKSEKEKEKDANEAAAYGDFMIVARDKSNLQNYAKALEKYGIPYELDGGENFGSAEEIRELHLLLNALEDHRNPVALVAALRGVFFGVSDNELYLYTKDGGTFSFYAEPDTARHKKIAAAFARLRKYKTDSIGVSPVTFVEELVNETGLIPYALSKPLGSTRAGNIIKLLELLRASLRDSDGTMSSLLSFISFCREESKTEEMSVSPSSGKVVRIMNLHKVKGLEAPVVFLVDPIKSAKKYATYAHIERIGASSVGYFTAFRIKGERVVGILAQPKGWAEHAKKEEEFLAAEKIRLDYVAATRAKNMLVVSMYNEGESERVWARLHKTDEFKPLPQIPAGKPRSEEDILKVPVTEYASAVKGFKDLKANSSAKTYDIESVTDKAKDGYEFRSSEGEGMAWGSAVHKMLELLGRNEGLDLSAAIDRVLFENGLSNVYKEDMLRTVNNVRNSAFWERSKKAKARYFEMPITVLENDTVMYGILDLVFKEDDGWVIVDYKTDNFAKDPDRREAYEKQLRFYQTYFEKATKEKVKDLKLVKV